MPESSNKGGRKPRVTDEDLLDVFRSTSDPVLSTAEVADAVPIKRRGTLNRLQALEEDGELESKQIGGRNTVWWLVDERDVSDTDRRSPATEDPAPVDEERDRPPEAPESDTVDDDTRTPSPGWIRRPTGATPSGPVSSTFASTATDKRASSSTPSIPSTRRGSGAPAVGGTKSAKSTSGPSPRTSTESPRRRARGVTPGDTPARRKRP